MSFQRRMKDEKGDKIRKGVLDLEASVPHIQSCMSIVPKTIVLDRCAVGGWDEPIG